MEIRNPQHAYDILDNADQYTSSLKSLKKIVDDVPNLEQNHQEYFSKQMALDFLKSYSPAKDGLSNDDLLMTYSYKLSTWKEYYQKYHIYFEQKIKNWNALKKGYIIADALLVSGAAFATNQIITSDMIQDKIDIICISTAILVFTSGIINIIIKQNSNLKNKNEILKPFRKIRKINDIQINKIKNKSKSK